MWLKDYGINVAETIRIRLEKIYRNKNGKLVAEATTTEDETRIQFNIKEDYANLPQGVYDLTCNNKSNNGFPFVELAKREAFMNTPIMEEDKENESEHTTEPEQSAPDWSTCNRWLDEEIQRTKERLETLETISKEWKRI